MPFNRTLLALALPFLAGSAALADHPGSHVRVVGGNIVEVDAVYPAPDSCHRVIEAVPGAPEGVTPPDDALPALVTISDEDSQGEGCLQEPTPLNSSFAMSLEDDKTVVQIYYLSRDGEVLSTERVELPAR